MSPSSTTLRARALAATDALAPAFPIGTFVAANPLRGMEHLRFEHAAVAAAAATGARSFLAESDYRDLYASGRIRDGELRAAIVRRWPEGAGPEPLHDDPRVEQRVASLRCDHVEDRIVRSPATRSEQFDDARRARTDGPPTLSERIDAMVAGWCAAYLDQGQADWELPGRDLGLYGSWRALAPRDPALARLVGRSGRRRVIRLPDAAGDALVELVARLEVPEHFATTYFRASLRRLPGWAAALARSGDSEDVVGYLALRLALEHLALEHLECEPHALGDLSAEPGRTEPESASGGVPEAIERLATWQEALELGYRDHLVGLLDAPRARPHAAAIAPVAQVVMCIDVRSEGFRRRLEETGPYSTVGFAGFFGLPVRIAALEREAVASCPVIVEPKATIVEVPDGSDVASDRRHDRYGATEAAWDARHDAKTSPAAPFAFAEAAGWLLGPLAALNTCAPRVAGRLRRRIARAAVPSIPTRMDLGADRTVGPVGLSLAEQVRVAHGALTTMGLTGGFAPLVVLCGHRSATTNNPFAAALDCGACAGKAGGPNARALAEVLNREQVRAGLADAGIHITASTWFVAAEHETTTDTVSVLDRHRVPASHREQLGTVEQDLLAAGRRLAVERRGALPGGGSAHRRSADWAEPVPEWGLARNAAVVVGPRELTAGLDLARRVFLHSYDPCSDPDGIALGTILTGPLVVGHWISSQYYFSSVDPVRHGAGTKPLHNVVGGIGVHEGPGGDLRVGLPLESVQFAGERVHEPMRLLAVVQAPLARLDALIERNAAVAQLLDNGWIRLVAGAPGGGGWFERRRGGTWTRWSPCDVDGVPARTAQRGLDRRELAGSMCGGAAEGPATDEEVARWVAND